MRRLLLGSVVVGLVAGCASGPVTGPDDRAVSLRTTACGNASRTTGSGVLVDAGLALTAAHVVAGAGEVIVGVDEVPGRVVVLDPARDLALVAFDGREVDEVAVAEADAGDEVRIVGGSSTGSTDATVVRRVVIDVDDVRATTRSDRVGYELDVSVAGGDSGAGVYDSDGKLVAVVFAVPTARDDATYAVGATEIRAVLDTEDRATHICDPAESRIVRAD